MLNSKLTTFAPHCDMMTRLQCDVSPERQSALDVLTSGRVLLQKNKESNVTPCSSHLSTTASASSSAPKKKELAQIVVDGNSYKIVWSALLLAEILLSYIDVAIQFAPITKDVIAKTVEIITLFDSRSKQLVLGNTDHFCQEMSLPLMLVLVFRSSGHTVRCSFEKYRREASWQVSLCQRLI